MLREAVGDLSNPSFRTAVLVGLASVPVALVLSWESVVDETLIAGATINGLPLFVAGMVVGSLYRSRSVDTRHAGTVAGVAASVSGVVVTLANAVTTVLSSSAVIAAVALLATPFLLVLGVWLSAFIGKIAAIVGASVTGYGARILPARAGN
jgi:hypothetical protein